VEKNRLKEEFRNNILSARKSLSIEEKNVLDDKIYKKLISSQYYNNCNIVFVYVSFGKEVDTLKIISKLLEDNKVVCVPKVINKKDGMKAIRINSLDELKVGYYNILEPTGIEEVDPENIELCLIPGLAFDNKGGRIGYGGGFYDRFLCRVSSKTKLIALAYKFQILEDIPMDDYDIRIQGIITS